MSDTGGVAAAPAAPAAVPPPSTPSPPPAPSNGAGATTWYAAMAEEDIGWLQSKGLAEGDAEKAAQSLAKRYRDLEAHRGVPAEQIFKWPRPEEGMQSVWDKLGVPTDPGAYDFSASTYEFESPEAAKPIADAMRDLGKSMHLTNEQLVGIHDFMLNQIKGNRDKEGAAATARMREADDLLKKSWGQHYETNEQLANNGFARIAELMEAAGHGEVLAKQAQGALDAMREAGYGAFGRELLRIIGRGFSTEDTGLPARALAPSAAQTREEARFKLSAYRNLGTPQGQALARKDPAAIAEHTELIRLAHAGEEGW